MSNGRSVFDILPPLLGQGRPDQGWKLTRRAFIPGRICRAGPTQPCRQL